MSEKKDVAESKKMFRTEWTVNGQFSRLGRCQWSVQKLFELSRNLPVMEVPLQHLNIYYVWEKLTLREMVTHFEAVRDADMSYPIILDEDGEVMDGRHRIMKAIIENHKTIKAVRFVRNPAPCIRDNS